MSESIRLSSILFPIEILVSHSIFIISLMLFIGNHSVIIYHFATAEREEKHTHIFGVGEITKR